MKVVIINSLEVNGRYAVESYSIVPYASSSIWGHFCASAPDLLVGLTEQPGQHLRVCNTEIEDVSFCKGCPKSL